MLPTVPVVDVAIFLKVEGCLAVCCDFVISKSLGLDLRKIWTKLVGRYNRTSRPTETVWFPFILLSTYKQSAYIRTLCKRPNDHELCYLCGTICLFSPRRQAIRQYVCTMSLPHTISANY